MFSPTVLGGGAQLHRGLAGMCGPNFTKLDEDMVHFQMQGRECSNLSDVENSAKFRTFWPQVKIMGEVDDISLPVVEALPPEYIWWPSTARLLSVVYW